MLQPQKSNFIYDYMGQHIETTRNVTNFSPALDFRYRFSKVSNLRVNYRGTTSQPSMTDLLDITDDSNPLNIKKGNPGLKPSFTHNFRLFYNNYIEKHQRALMTFVNFSMTRNSISDMVTYDDKTGGRTTQPETSTATGTHEAPSCSIQPSTALAYGTSTPSPPSPIPMPWAI